LRIPRETKLAIFQLVDIICYGASAGEVELSIEKLAKFEPSSADDANHSIVLLLHQSGGSFKGDALTLGYKATSPTDPTNA
jgi:hypothetical protein